MEEPHDFCEAMTVRPWGRRVGEEAIEASASVSGGRPSRASEEASLQREELRLTTRESGSGEGQVPPAEERELRLEAIGGEGLGSYPSGYVSRVGGGIEEVISVMESMKSPERSITAGGDRPSEPMIRHALRCVAGRRRWRRRFPSPSERTMGEGVLARAGASCLHGSPSRGR